MAENVVKKQEIKSKQEEDKIRQLERERELAQILKE